MGASIVKVKQDTVTITSYYCKLFVTRNANNVSNYSKFITRVINDRGNNSEDQSITNLVYGINSKQNDTLPRAYTAVGNTIRRFYTPMYKFFWSFGFLTTNFSDKEITLAKGLDLVPCGRTIENDIILGMDNDGLIYTVTTEGKGLLGTLPYLIDPKLGDGPLEYSEVGIFSKKVPLVLVFAYMLGLDGILNQMGIPFTINPTTFKSPKDRNVINLKFKDVIYSLTITTPAQKLLIGGFAPIAKELTSFKANSLNNQQVYKSLLSSLGVSQHHLREIKLLWDMFIDPITLGILKELKEPTDILGLLLKANDLLIDDFIPEIVNVRYKFYERVVGMAYKQIINSLRTFRQNRLASAQVVMNPYSVWLDIIQDQSITIVEESNPLQNLKEKESITHGGNGGRSTVTMVKDTRGFSKDDLGVISESSPDSAKVGVRVYSSANPNFTSLRGLTRPFNKDTDGPSSVLSTTALISSAVTHDDNM